MAGWVGVGEMGADAVHAGGGRNGTVRRTRNGTTKGVVEIVR